MNEFFTASAPALSRKSAESNREYYDVISKISHEIRNPLTLIYSSIQLVEKRYPELPGTELWGQLKLEVEDTIALLNDLTSYNRNDMIKPERIRPSAFLASMDAACRPSMESLGIEFDTYTLNKIPPIYADPAKLKEALLNLLRNAQDAVSDLPDNGSSYLRHHYHTSYASHPVTKRIDLYIEYTGFFINFHVRDNGTGIPSEYIDTLFDPFVTHKRTGTGLGLSIVKTIAENHGGAVTLLTNTQQPDTYTDFCFSLPVDADETLM
jgi:signal transduction histidine kinase